MKSKARKVSKKSKPRKISKKSKPRKVSKKASRKPRASKPKRAAASKPKRAASKSKSKPRRGCVMQFTKKYLLRPSPPFPANECCGQYGTGNDGRRYQSRPASNGICRWVPV